MNSNPEPNGWILIQSPTDGFSSRAQRLDSHPDPNEWIPIQSPTDGFSSRAQRMDSHPEPNGWIPIQSPTDGFPSRADSRYGIAVSGLCSIEEEKQWWVRRFAAHEAEYQSASTVDQQLITYLCR